MLGSSISAKQKALARSHSEAAARRKSFVTLHGPPSSEIDYRLVAHPIAQIYKHNSKSDQRPCGTFGNTLAPHHAAVRKYPSAPRNFSLSSPRNEVITGTFRSARGGSMKSSSNTSSFTRNTDKNNTSNNDVDNNSDNDKNNDNTSNKNGAKNNSDHLRYQSRNNMGDNSLIYLCISGCEFQVLRRNLLKFPLTRLGQLAKTISQDAAEATCDQLIARFDTSGRDFRLSNFQCYFDRSPYAFDAILSLYRYEELHIPDNYCIDLFGQELDFWLIPREYLAECCAAKMNFMACEVFGNLITADPNKPKPKTPHKQEDVKPTVITDVEIQPLSQWAMMDFAQQKWRNLNQYRSVVWECMENPKASTSAIVFNVFSISFVMATMLCLIISSMPQFHDRSQSLIAPNNSSDGNLQNKSRIAFGDDDEFYTGLEIADTICVAFFTVEFFVRLWAAPHRLSYTQTFMFWIDFLAVFPFYIELIMKLTGYENETFGDFRRSLLMIRVLRGLRVMRVLRILKVARYSRGFQSVGATIQKSWKELLMLILFILTTNVMFSTVIFFLEGEENSKFESIPASSWWCIITMTTVGYGDVYPVTALGKLVAGVVSIVGIILLAFPISVIVENFHEEYSETPPEPIETQLDDELQMAANNFMALNPTKIINGIMICDLKPLIDRLERDQAVHVSGRDGCDSHRCSVSRGRGAAHGHDHTSLTALAGHGGARKNSNRRPRKRGFKI